MSSLYERLERLSNLGQLDRATLAAELSRVDQLADAEQDNPIWPFLFARRLTDREVNELLEQYLDKGGDIVAPGDYGTALAYCASESRLAVAQFLVSRCGLEPAKDDTEWQIDGEPESRLAFMGFLVAHGVSIQAVGRNMLVRAMRDRDESLFDQVVAAGYAISPDDVDLLSRATTSRFCERLLDAGVKPEAEGEAFLTPLSEVVINLAGDLERLGGCGPDSGRRSGLESTVADLKRWIQLLIARGARLDCSNIADGYQTLIDCANGNQEVIDFLIDCARSDRDRDTLRRQRAVGGVSVDDATHVIVIECPDRTIELGFASSQPDWVELYNSLGVVLDEEPDQYERDGKLVGHLRSPHSIGQTIEAIIEDAGKVSSSLARRLRQLAAGDALQR